MAGRRRGGRGGTGEFTLGWIPDDLPAKVQSFLRRHPAFTESWYFAKKRGNTSESARALIELRSRLSADDIYSLLEYQLSIPDGYGIPPIYWADAVAIARSKLPTEQWYERHPSRMAVAQDNQDDHWDAVLSKMQKRGVVVYSSPEVARRRAARLARKRKRDN